ncbi:MAG: CCA tRNA nucleotidyltransferase [Candidatus Pacebacteria bacterium]|jgi:poly(A) polymerase/tRNA nucleotidyltransferase (CCA-adding enzyme)|nr:CCA tRNA nucleotidyltransferase [Candidatus Paceibacterota bacterium]
MKDFFDKIPPEVKFAIEEMQKSGFKAYIVGGCVRDLLAGNRPSDWDLATDASPDQIQCVFPDNFCDNKFGTVTARIREKDALDADRYFEIEITPYRIESKYTDKRHPDSVEWADNINDDLSRRDFTVNAIALSYIKEGKTGRLKTETIDLFGGKKDLEDKLIRAVRDPGERFLEDALRMMRAVRFSITLGPGWRIEGATEAAIVANAKWLKEVSEERIRDEFEKIIKSKRPAEGVEILRKLGLLERIMPELAECYGIGQNKHHLYDVYTHLLKSLDYAAKQDFNFYVRMASLLHDIGKPKSKAGDGPDSTFYNHEMIGAKIARKMLARMKFSRKDADKIVHLVRYHLFYYNVGEVGEASVRRLVRNVGQENLEDLLQVRMADRIGSGCPKAEPYKLRHLRYLMEKTSQDPITARMIKVNGNDIIKILNIQPGPKIGQILNVLLAQVLDDPAKNDRGVLEIEVVRLGALSPGLLENESLEAEKKIGVVEVKRDEMTKKKYWVT